MNDGRAFYVERPTCAWCEREGVEQCAHGDWCCPDHVHDHDAQVDEVIARGMRSEQFVDRVILVAAIGVVVLLAFALKAVLE